MTTSGTDVHHAVREDVNLPNKSIGKSESPQRAPGPVADEGHDGSAIAELPSGMIATMPETRSIRVILDL